MSFLQVLIRFQPTDSAEEPYFYGAGSLTDVSVEAASVAESAEGIRVASSQGAVIVLDRVFVKATSPTRASGLTVNSPAVVDGLRVDSSDWGIELGAGGGGPAPFPVTLTMTNSDVRGGRGGLIGAPGQSSAFVRSSSITGTQFAVWLNSPGSVDFRAAHTQLSGLVGYSGPNFAACLGGYDANFFPLNASCQRELLP